MLEGACSAVQHNNRRLVLREKRKGINSMRSYPNVSCSIHRTIFLSNSVFTWTRVLLRNRARSVFARAMICNGSRISNGDTFYTCPAQPSPEAVKLREWSFFVIGLYPRVQSNSTPALLLTRPAGFRCDLQKSFFFLVSSVRCDSRWTTPR